MSLFILIALAVVALDRVTKWLVVRHIPLGHEVPIIGQWGLFTHIKNTGAAFGLFPGSVVPLIVVSLLASIIVVVMAQRASRMPGPGQAGRLVPLGLILGGAVGNLIDRIVHHKVTDFILVGIPNGSRFPVFNVADSAVTIGVTLLAIGIYFSGQPAEPTSSEALDPRGPDAPRPPDAVRAFGAAAPEDAPSPEAAARAAEPAADPRATTPSETTADAVPGDTR